MNTLLTDNQRADNRITDLLEAQGITLGLSTVVFSPSDSAKEKGIEHDLVFEEKLLLSSISSPKRRVEFIVGRAAAHRALSQLGRRAAVLRREGGLPSFPEGVTGSLSHTIISETSPLKLQSASGCAIVARSEKLAVSQARDWASLGVDIEPATRVVPNELGRRILADGEAPPELNSSCADPAEGHAVSPLLCVFSAKEALHKALTPLGLSPESFRRTFLRWGENAPEPMEPARAPALYLPFSYDVTLAPGSSVVNPCLQCIGWVFRFSPLLISVVGVKRSDSRPGNS